MPKPPPPANMPTAVTATDRRAAGQRPIWPSRHTWPGSRPGSGRGRSGSLQPPAAAAGRWVALDAAQLGGEVRHSADVSVAQEMGNGERPLRGGDLHHRAHINVPVGHQLPSPVSGSMHGRVGAAARATLATTKAVSDKGGSCPASSRFAVVMSTSTSPYIGILLRPARMAAVTSRRLGGKGPHLHLARTFNRHH